MPPALPQASRATAAAISARAWAVTSLAVAPPLFAANAQCGTRTLPAYTQDRGAHLRPIERARASAMPPSNAGAKTQPYAAWAAAQLSVNLQYLQQQRQMQHQGRSHTAIFHIMKTEHDTVKSSISNTR